MLKFTNTEKTSATFNDASFSLDAPEDLASIGDTPTRDAVRDWLAAGNQALPLDPPTPAQVAAAAKAEKNIVDSASADAYAKLTALKAMSPAQVQSWVTTLAQAQDAIATLAIAVSILARQL